MEEENHMKIIGGLFLAVFSAALIFFAEALHAYALHILYEGEVPADA